jgi:hypothetical protein
MRFHIIEFLIIVSVVGFACTSLQQSDPLYETLFFSFTLASVLGSIFLAVGRNGGARAFWAGFGISSLSYFVFAHMPDADEMVPRHNGPELTTQLLRHGYHWLHADTGGNDLTSHRRRIFADVVDPFASDSDDHFSMATDQRHTSIQIVEPDPASFSLIVGGGQQIAADGRSISFMRIGHAAWALLLGWMGGHFTQTVYDRSRPDRTTQ